MAEIGAGGISAITQGEIVLGLSDGAAALYTKDSLGAIVAISGSGGGGSGVSVPSVVGTYIDSDSNSATSQVLSAPTYVEGNLLVAVIMSRNSGGTLTPPTGFVLHGTYLSSITFSGDFQTLSVFTKTATASEPTSYTWTQANSARICGWIASVTSDAYIETVLESYGNAETATINTLSGRLNLTAATWLYALDASETYDQSGDGIVEITDSPNARARISGGYTSTQTIVTSTHASADVDNDPNHGMINIVLKGVTSIDSNYDVDTSSTPPTDGQVLTWVDANSQWEPAQLPDAVATRALLGIEEYVDDSAAGTGGIASGAMYYNTTSSDYRLKS